ncbi:MAG TPA: SpoIIE family protein phosphatase [Actinomycetota bacterium]|nr:SpoIIE family protein phosphatase [Actinomycetota bacterium]
MQSRPTARPAAGMVHELVVGPGRRRTVIGLVIGLAGPFLLAPMIERLHAPAGLFLIAVVAAAGVGWLWPGLVAAAASFLAHSAFIASSAGGFVIGTNAVILLVVFVAIAVLVSVEEAARARSRAIQERVTFLADANRIITTSLDYGTTLQNLTHLAVPRLADWCAVHLRSDDDSQLTFRVAHANPEKVDIVEKLWKRYPPDPNDPNSSMFRVLRTGKPVVLRNTPTGLFEGHEQDEDHREMLDEVGMRSAILVPLSGSRGPIGVLTLAHAESGRRHRRIDLPFVEELARTASMAIENARVHQERSRIAQTLQNSLLPPETPEIPGLDVAVRYRPAGSGNLVGGDFYDVFEAGERSWAVAVGDVCGKGPEAAAITGLVRQTIRTAATQESDPSVVLSTVNHEMIRTNGDRFCTVALGRIERNGNGSINVMVSCGGHPPPLVYRPARKIEAADCLGTLLGVFPEPHLEKAPVQLRPGDALIFYTDGVTERLERTGKGGDSTLVALLWESDSLNAAGIADRIYVEAAAATREKPRDDIAIVVIRVPEMTS